MMAVVADDDNVAFAVLLDTYIIAREEKDEQQTDQLQSQPQRVRRAAVRQFWVRPWLREERRQQLGQLSSLLDTHLRLEDPVAFENSQSCRGKSPFSGNLSHLD